MKEIKITLPTKRPYKAVFQLKIVLKNTRPAVWRRIQVPETYTFYELHVAVQNAMGWMDSHLHAFETDKGPRLRDKMRIESPYALDDIEEEDFVLTTEIPLNRFFLKPGDRVFYDYDFGDNWEHEIELEKILPKEKGKKYPRCLDGALTCPPEDCGGTSGYGDCKAAVQTGAASNELLDWLGDWTPDDFDPAKDVFENPRKRLKESLEG